MPRTSDPLHLTSVRGSFEQARKEGWGFRLEPSSWARPHHKPRPSLLQGRSHIEAPPFGPAPFFGRFLWPLLTAPPSSKSLPFTFPTQPVLLGGSILRLRPQGAHSAGSLALRIRPQGVAELPGPGPSPSRPIPKALSRARVSVVCPGEPKVCLS